MISFLTSLGGTRPEAGELEVGAEWKSSENRSSCGAGAGLAATGGDFGRALAGACWPRFELIRAVDRRGNAPPLEEPCAEVVVTPAVLDGPTSVSCAVT